MSIKQYRFIIHGIMLFTILATIMIFFDSKISLLLFSIGISSGFIAFGVFSAAVVSLPFGVLTFIWFCIFPIILTISYILAVKKRYSLFCCVVALDALIVIMWSLYSIISNNIYSFQQFLLYLIFSPIVSIIVIWGKYHLKR